MFTAYFVPPPSFLATLCSMIFTDAPFDWMALLSSLIQEFMSGLVCC